eukprot:SAG31_NODE_273_length_18667_cov_3.603619_18_plen_178_part_00
MAAKEAHSEAETSHAAELNRAVEEAVEAEGRQNSKSLASAIASSSALEEKLHAQLIRNANAAKESQSLRNEMTDQVQLRENIIAAHAVELATTISQKEALSRELDEATRRHMAAEAHCSKLQREVDQHTADWYGAIPTFAHFAARTDTSNRILNVVLIVLLFKDGVTTRQRKRAKNG